MEINMIEKEEIPLLLTGTIDANTYNIGGNSLLNINERLSQYESAVKRYIMDSPFTLIVFIDNSGYQFNEEKYKSLAEKYHKKFEFISGKICKEEIVKYGGKSWGDAYLISEGLKKSVLLKDVEYFYKITGRIFLRNSEKICKTRKKYRNEFIVYPGIDWCFTNIFKANRKDYLTVFGDAYRECNERTRDYIEKVFYMRLINSKIDVGSFETYPYFEGRRGVDGKNYSGGLIERSVRSIMARAHCFSIYSKTSRIVTWAFRIKGISKDNL